MPNIRRNRFPGWSLSSCFLDSTRSCTIDSSANAPLLCREGVSGDGGGTAGAEVEFVWVGWLIIQSRWRRRLVLPCTDDGCQSCLLYFKRAWDVPRGEGAEGLIFATGCNGCSLSLPEGVAQGRCRKRCLRPFVHCGSQPHAVFTWK